MTWPQPSSPMRGFCGSIVVIASVLVGAWLFSPIFNFLMRVLQ